ncbi:adenylate/guanylate cyclase domain-containing protein [Mycobacterium sp. 852002-51961_SCH5331710]|uniref:ATP-binding protein n=1 Tax=Mycobacterium sp. 852002-51961_SCH5331710 TaxID=1834105 RepID=UPI000B2BBEE9|nr:adenylate/guanylate cyclase domain-containing protein [Mycobacterium sp. 852002-51961_SCH5331710]
MSAGDPPTGVVTFLFTDIEGSTRRWESDADAMRVALACHDKVLRSAIEAHDGFVFSHSGDGLAAAFASPSAAVDAAVDAQRGLELPVRMGIATGEAELRDGDYFGTVLNRAARVMAAGHGGQILVAESTAVSLDGVELLNLGPRRLRDVTHPITIFQLRTQGLPRDFPPLRSLDADRGNFRPAGRRLVGRDDEVARIAAALRTNRFVTLTGVGGVGKTRLALEVAGGFANDFTDGVWVFELASVADASAVADSVAAILGIAQQPGMSMRDSVAAVLENRKRLLIFDNCEHVLDAAASLVEAILAKSSTVSILATSREGLGVAEEQIWPVRSLSDHAAAELFVERAGSIALGTAVHDLKVVTDICRRLDGIPLAIELAASRVSVMTLTDIRDRLDKRFQLLVGSRRSLERHQTLRHAVQWSYDLLSAEEKRLLERCSVFAGGFDIRSACAVAGPEYDEFAVVDLLDSLVRKSLLTVDRSEHTARFSMLETVRQFAEEQLAFCGAAEEVRTAHARYFAQREGAMMSLWNSPEQHHAYRWVATELANLRTAFRWAADNGDIDVAATITTYVGLLGFGTENYEPIAWAEEVIEPAVAVGHPRVPSLYVIAAVAWMAGRLEQALRYAEIGATVLAHNENTPPHGMEGWLGAAYLPGGEPLRWAEMCQAQLKRRGDSDVYIRGCRVFALTFGGRIDEAMQAAEGLVEAGAATDNPYLYTFAVAASTFPSHAKGSVTSIQICSDALAMALESGNRFNASILALAMARFEALDAVNREALEHLTLVLRNYHDSGNVGSIRSPLAVLSTFLDRVGRYEEAAVISGFSLSPLALAVLPEFTSSIAHLRTVLGDDTYESLAREGGSMTLATIVAFAYEQIDHARAQLQQLR